LVLHGLAVHRVGWDNRDGRHPADDPRPKLAYRRARWQISSLAVP
jgi:hypothetical protein